MKTIYTTVTLVASQRQKCCTDDIKNSSSINAAINVTSHSPKSGYTGDFTHTNHAVGVNQIPDYWGHCLQSTPPPPLPPPPPKYDPHQPPNRGGSGANIAGALSLCLNQSINEAQLSRYTKASLQAGSLTGYRLRQDALSNQSKQHSCMSHTV